jgi:hypothetical protein
MKNEPISPLRQRMLDAMAVRNFSDKTRHDYIRHVGALRPFLAARPTPPMPTICAGFNCIKGRTECSRRA